MKSLLISSFLFLMMLQTRAQMVAIKLPDAERLLSEKGMVIDKSVNRRLLKNNMKKNPERWQAAFQYLLTQDLQKVGLGTVELMGKECFVTISEYKTKEAKNAKIESHKRYIDIQMVIKGEENIGLVLPRDATVKQPYIAERDVAFYSAHRIKNHQANARTIFVFFSEDYHQPGLAVDNPAVVRKVVVKVME